MSDENIAGTASGADRPKSALQVERDHLHHAVHPFAHMLSEQGPMNITFVHNNTLLGLQKRPFNEAVAEAERVLGGKPYLTNQAFRAHFANGRIDRTDLAAAFAYVTPTVDLGHLLLDRNGVRVTAGDVRHAHLSIGIESIEPAALRWQALHGSALEKLRAELPASVSKGMITAGVNDLKAKLARVGEDWTLAHFVGELTGLDLPAALREKTLQHLSDSHASAPDRKSSLRALGIAKAHQERYLRCIDSEFADAADAAAAPDRVRDIWLGEEAALVDQIARRHFGVNGDVSSLARAIEADPQGWTVKALWQASLAKFALDDPFGLSDPNTLEERDPERGSVEKLSERFRHMQSWGGPPVPLDPELRLAIEQQVKAAIAASGGDAGSATSARDRLHLSHIVLHGLGPDQINRRGAEALETLLSLPGAGETAAAVLAALQSADPRKSMLAHCHEQIADDIEGLSRGRSHADLLRTLTGNDPAERVNQYLIRLCGAFLDEGLAAWRLPARALGFFDAWRSLALNDSSLEFDDLPGWRDALLSLPTLPEDAIIHCLRQLGIEQAAWGEYLGRQLMRLKGWAAMMYWYELHPSHDKQAVQPADTIQYLAVRLFCETQLVRKIFGDVLQIDTSLNSLGQKLHSHPAEYLVRRSLYANELPDFLAEPARDLIDRLPYDLADDHDRWRDLADQIWMYRQSDLSDRRTGASVYSESWRLFNLAQLTGIGPETLRSLTVLERDQLMAELDAFPARSHGPVWQVAFERHYRDEVLNAISLNHGRGRWQRRDRRPKSQVIMCIDEREENLHRHFEELDPDHESLGAAGFFGIAMNYIGLDDHNKSTPLCPAVVTPSHRVYEVPREQDLASMAPLHAQRAGIVDTLHNTYWEAKRNLASSYFVFNLLGFLSAIPLLGRVLVPNGYMSGVRRARLFMVPPVKTRLAVTRMEPDEAERLGIAAGGAGPVGFTDVEQTDRCEGMLRNIGLTYGFAPIVIWCAHGSSSENNPHENAHDCGACGGKQGAPNSRAISAMLNRPVVRDALRARGIDVPDDTWFLGAIHNTASDEITYSDVEDIPAALRPHFEEVRGDLYEASLRSAQERCRRFGSAPKDATPEASFRHVVERSKDFSQVRPEWGHATNAFALVGRRSATQGVFFDRRGFVISYDASQDPTGAILERILMAVGPVGAGINLEYYFSTVDPLVYGSGTKVPHNVTGMIGIMEGAQSDLRTGLPSQMTEVHEAMRLQLIVEAAPEVLGGIYGRQAAIRELLDGAWVHLVSLHPETGEINIFVPGTGFVKWNEPLQPIPEVASSFDWYRGKYLCFLPPARITEPVKSWRNRSSKSKSDANATGKGAARSSALATPVGGS